MPFIEKMEPRQITGANYITSVNGMLHPDRILPEHDFLYMLDGSWEIYEQETSFEMENDDLLILAAGRHHYGVRKCNPGNRHMYIHVLPTEKENQINSLSETKPNGREYKSCPDETPGRPVKEQTTAQLSPFIPSLVHCRDNPRIRQYFHEIIAVCLRESREKPNRLSLLFNLLLCELYDMLESQEGSWPADPMVEEIMRLVQSTPQTFFSAKELAQQYFICERTLNNHFLKVCGKTFCVWQMDTKLEMARQFLLSQPMARLREAAVNFGFYDEFHLSKAFKKKYGQPPSCFRQSKR